MAALVGALLPLYSLAMAHTMTPHKRSNDRSDRCDIKVGGVGAIVGAPLAAILHAVW